MIVKRGLLILLIGLVVIGCTTTPPHIVQPTSTSSPTPLPLPTPVPPRQTMSAPLSLDPTETPPATASSVPTLAPPPNLIPQEASIQLGKGEITAVTLSQDRKVLAVGSRAGVCLYHVEGYEEIWCDRTPLWEDRSWILTLAFRPQGDVLAAGMTGGQVLLWDVTHGARLAERAFSQYEFVNALAWSPDGSQLAVSSNNLQIVSWDGVSLELAERLGRAPTVISALSWSPDGEILVWSESQGTLILWDLAAEAPIATVELPNFKVVHTIFWTMDGNLMVVWGSFLASGCCYTMSGGISILEPQTGEIKREYDSLLWFDTGNDLTIADLSPDETVMAVGGGYYGEESVAVFDMGTGELLAKLPRAKREGGIVWVDEHRLLTVQGQTLVEWEWQTGDVTPVSTDYYPPAVSAAWSPDGTMLASSHAEYSDQLFHIVVWDVRTGETLYKLQRETWVSRVWWQANGTEVLWAEAGDQIYTWNLATKDIHPYARLPHQQYFPIEPSPDGKLLAVANLQELTPWELNLWNLDTGQRQYTVEMEGEIGCFAWAQDSTRLAICNRLEGGQAGVILILNALTGEKEATIHPESDVQKLSWSADGTRLAGNMGGWLVGWEVKTESELWKISVDANGRPITGVAFSPQKEILATSGQNVALFDASRFLSNTPTATFTGQEPTVYDVIFSPDGNQLASLSDDGTIVIWDLDRVDHLLDWSPDRARIAMMTGYFDKEQEVVLYTQSL